MLTRRKLLSFGGAAALHAAESPLVAQWRAIAAQTDGVVGAAALRLDSGEMVALRGDERFPLASVCKLPIAMAILAMVADGNLRLDQEIEVPRSGVVPSVSPIADRWARGETRFRLDEMIRLMIARSDNTAVQTLFRTAGGAPGLAARLRAW